MIEHIWSLICSFAVIDQNTNNVSVFNILEQATIPEEAINNDAIGIGVELITLWVRSDLMTPVKGISRVNLIAPNGEILKSVQSDIDLLEFERLRTRGLFQGIPYKGEGTYRFAVDYKCDNNGDWVQAASIPLKVRLLNEGKN